MLCEFSNRIFPAKTILTWRMSSNQDHCNLISQYFKKTEEFNEIQVEELISENGNYDSLYVVIGKKGEQNIIK